MTVRGEPGPGYRHCGVPLQGGRVGGLARQAVECMQAKLPDTRVRAIASSLTESGAVLVGATSGWVTATDGCRGELQPGGPDIVQSGV